MRAAIYRFVKQFYWSMPISDHIKDNIITQARKLHRNLATAKPGAIRQPSRKEQQADYIKQILSIPKNKKDDYIELCKDAYVRDKSDPKVIAYYLTQFHPTTENDEWWGRGTTEWSNVSRAVPQYIGHYQPRFPGELGYYDLRIEDNISRQVELAKMYGVYGFAFYFYWFDGLRLLEKPLDLFVNSKEIDFPFCLCWANESWTRRFDGTCGEILIRQSDTVESYREFIKGVISYMQKANYIRIDDRPVLIVYRPSFIPDIAATLNYWRKYCEDAGLRGLYIIGVREHTWDKDLLKFGFDAQTEFHPGTIFKQCTNITNYFNYMHPNFGGVVLDYKEIVDHKKYFNYHYSKLYRAVMPMWDNTARRNNMGMIFEGATPELYKRWLKDILSATKHNKELDDAFVFINAWNEWGEGAYLEPDRRYGYAYLQKTREAIEETRG